jgi:enoyl-CoA hydratase/carnithine racemase
VSSEQRGRAQTPARATRTIAASGAFACEVAEGGVATLTLNRPEKLNALTFEAYRELRDFFQALQTREEVRALILTGTGAGFCSGGDLIEIVGELTRMGGPEILAFTRLTGATALAIRQLRKPVIAAINGVAVGAGAVLALAADMRVASERARFGFVSPQVGLSGADMGACWLLPRLVGMGRATELLMTGDIIDAYTADRFGLVNRVVPHEQLLSVAGDLADQLASGPTFAHGMTKEMLNREAHMDFASAVEAEAQAQQICVQTHDFREAYRAMMRKRGPKFEGR